MEVLELIYKPQNRIHVLNFYKIFDTSINFQAKIHVGVSNIILRNSLCEDPCRTLKVEKNHIIPELLSTKNEDA